MDMAADLKPFGELSCEDEVRILGEEYSRYYFEHTRFNLPALDQRTFLIIGRRGSGKTSLGEHFAFQKTLKNAIAINVNEPELFHDMMRRIPSTVSHSREIEIPRLVKVWHLLIWQVVFFHLQDHDPSIKVASLMNSDSGTLPSLLIHALKALLARLLGDDDDVIVSELENILGDVRFKAAQKAAMEIAKKRPVIIAVDTLENYSVSNAAMMEAVAALIQCGSDFNRDYSNKNIHLKIFVMAEVFPHLKEEVLLNLVKHVHDEVYLHWRPKDLLRLISWRFHYYLNNKSLLPRDFPTIDWDSYQDVLRKVWEEFFGRSLQNSNGLPEKTFPYVLRHTQMRPRQLILLCNSIARTAHMNGVFKNFSEQDLIMGIKNAETKLAEEVISSYNTVYPNASRIIEALSGIPVKFKGSELDKRAPATASQWGTERAYSPFDFRQLVAELGIVGRVRRQSETTGYVEADFEYASEGRIPLLPTDDCVIHPMFFRRLNVTVEPKIRVYPFPDHPEFKDLEY